MNPFLHSNSFISLPDQRMTTNWRQYVVFIWIFKTRKANWSPPPNLFYITLAGILKIILYMTSYLLLMAFFYQWDPSTATLMKETYGLQGGLLKNKPFCHIHPFIVFPQRNFISEFFSNLFFLTNDMICWYD